MVRDGRNILLDNDTGNVSSDAFPFEVSSVPPTGPRCVLIMHIFVSVLRTRFKWVPCTSVATFLGFSPVMCENRSKF